MTIPTLMTKVNGMKYRSQFKKSLSTLNGAVRMAIAQYDTDFASSPHACTYGGMSGSAKEATLETDTTFCALFNSTLTGQTFHLTLATVKDKKGVRYTPVQVPGYTYTIRPGVLPIYYAYTLADGTLLVFPFMAAECDLPTGTPLTSEWLQANKSKCVGFIDVNGVSLPNKEVTCSGPRERKNTASYEVEDPCIVANDANHLTDIYPVVFHNGTVEPATDAAKYVLSTAK